MTEHCNACGKPLVKGAPRCGWCNVTIEQKIIAVREGVPDTKVNRIILAKIATKEEEMKACGQTGPGLLILVGLIGLIWVVGIIAIIAGLIWSTTRTNQKKKLQLEIKELEAALEYPPLSPLG